MADRVKVIKLATDMIYGRVASNFADASKNSEALVAQLIELNGGKKELSLKTFHRGNEVFEIIEALIPAIVHEGLMGDEFFFNMVEYRNLELGDDIDFWTENKSEFIVADGSYGVTGVRRQRLGEMEKYNVATSLKVIKVYEEAKRLMAGRVDFDTFVQKVATAMAEKLKEDVYNAFASISATSHGLNSTYVPAGTYTEDELLELVEHVEISTKRRAVIYGTRKALRKVTTAVRSREGDTDMYNMGYYGKFNGTDMIVVPQRHEVGTDNFLLDDDKIYILASDDKPIKVVNVGEGIIQVKEAVNTADFTQNYLYGQEFGVGLCFNEKIGVMKTA